MTHNQDHQDHQDHQADPFDLQALPSDPDELHAHLDQMIRDMWWVMDANDEAKTQRYRAFFQAVAEQSGELEHQAWAHWSEGVTLFFQDPRAALDAYEAAQRTFATVGRTRESARLSIVVAHLLGQLGQLEQATTAIERAMRYFADQPDYPGWSTLYINLAYIQWLQGRYEATLATAQQAEASAQRFNQPTQQARALINQALAGVSLGRFELAETQLQAAYTLAQNYGAAELVGRATLNMSRLALYKGDLFAALHWLDEVRAAFREANIEVELATADIEEAGLYERLRMRPEAQQTALRAADTFEQAGLPNESVEARLLAVRLMFQRGKSSQAHKHLAQAQRLAPAASATFQAMIQGYAAHPLRHSTPEARQRALAEVDEACSKLHDLGAVHQRLQIGLIGAALAVDNSSVPGTSQLPGTWQNAALERYEAIAREAHEQMLPELEQQAYVGVARLLPPQAACQPLRRAADLVTRRRQQMPIEELKAHLLSGHAHVYTQLIEAQLASQQPILALQTLLEAKGGIWADLATPRGPFDKLRDRRRPTPLDTEWIQAKEKWHHWREELLRWQQEEHNSNSPSYQALCQAQQKTIKERLQAIEATITKLSRRQHRLRPATSLPSVAEVQANLPADGTVVEYFVGSADIWAVIMSSSATPQWVRLCRRRDVNKTLTRLNLRLKSLQNKTPEQRRKVAQLQQPATDKLCRQLYNLLLAPIEELRIADRGATANRLRNEEHEELRSEELRISDRGATANRLRNKELRISDCGATANRLRNEEELRSEELRISAGSAASDFGIANAGERSPQSAIRNPQSEIRNSSIPHSAIRNPQSEILDSAIYSLSRRDPQSEIPRLILAPDDLLYTVPWSALQQEGQALGEAYRLTLLPSALVLGLPRPERSPSSPSGAPLALGYAGNPPLQYITAELDAIERAVPEVQRVEPAPVSALTEARSPRWLHIATHGHINRRSPLLSSLELADGHLLLADALNLTLTGTDLVTLSGCQTGTAPESGGVVLALSGAFLSAGAQTVLSSLWSVDDQATQLLMSHLYAALQQGTSLPAALQQAQQAVRTQGYHHPFYWAAFYPLSLRLMSS
ncbi:MAG: CHAT domain-containing protein [Ardenticatenaceae bacterium]